MEPPLKTAVSVALSPMQILASLTWMVGGGNTLTIAFAVVLQPVGLVTVTLYSVSTNGETWIVDVVSPVLQRIVPPVAFAVSVAVPPTQIAAPSTVTVGAAFT